MLLYLFYLIFLIVPLQADLPVDEEAFMHDSEESLDFYTEYAKFYDLAPNAQMRDITSDVLNSSYVSDSQKKTIQKNKRRIVVFSYPSDGLKIKGLISFVPDANQQPLVVLLRGGNGILGVLSPGSDLVNLGQCTVLCTMYRGSVSEGADEFGGDDVHDVKSLIDFIPTLENKLGIKIQNNKKYLIGRSRGGMEMFLVLSRYPELQNYFTKAVSLSGVLDMRKWIASRADVEETFTEKYGYQKSVNGEEWINKRDPILTVPSIKKQLPILIVHGTADKRVSIDVGMSMVSKLKSAGNNVTYWEIEGGEHCINNILDRSTRILNWLQS